MEVWEKIKKELSAVYSDTNNDPWLTIINPVSFIDNHMVLSVPDDFSLEWIRNHYQSDIIKIAKSSFGDTVEVELIIDHREDIYTDAVPSGEKKAFPVLETNSIGLLKNYIFDNYIVGESNKFASAASLAVAQNPGKAYNPLFIYGGVGLGKTHILNAIGNYIEETKGGINIIYLTAETFVNDLVNHLRDKKMDQFREVYRNCDVLLIDDIQFISNKERSQEEMFHTFNTLYQENKQIVFTSDRLPKEIPNIEERLKSRFEMGLIADIQVPDIETKVAIIKKKAETDNIEIDDEIAFYLAYNTQSNIRELEGYLTRLSAYTVLTKIKLNINVAKEVLSSLIRKKDKWLTIEDIQRAVAAHFKIKVSDLLSDKRMKYISYPRQIAMFLSRTLTNASFPEIGVQFGNKDHSTVIHSVNKISDMIKNDSSVKEVVEKIKKGMG
ncbi:MAG: chromosomal replication initiator protein DnaA [Deltaproteobacteria bacterium]|nr:chromosomal replication initiator protein DnaA [Deltaproteobacteria bacterium]MCL5276663.1 chromosomal replication initiator protein DnaA [Deltaproteobacteria bacterium]